MKNLSKKLLFCLSHPQQKESFSVATDQVRQWVPTLSPAGFRSLLHLLKTQGLVAAEPLGGITYWRVTDIGLDALGQELPVLQALNREWSGQWECLVFKEAPTFDRQFRYLRDFLLKKGALSLSRGVYLYPGHFPEAILEESRGRYRTSIAMFELGSWIIGDDRSFIIEKYALLDLAEAYSGISTEIERLISRKQDATALTNQEKKQVYSLFDRLYLTALDDHGLLPHYFPQVPTVWYLLRLLQRLT